MQPLALNRYQHHISVHMSAMGIEVVILGAAYPVVTLENNVLGAVPITELHCRLEVGSMVTVKVGEDAILVLQAAIVSYGGSVVLDSRERTGSRGLGSEGAGGKVGDRRRRGSRRSGYHGEYGPSGCTERLGEKRSIGGEAEGDRDDEGVQQLSFHPSGAAIPAPAEYPPFPAR